MAKFTILKNEQKLCASGSIYRIFQQGDSIKRILELRAVLSDTDITPATLAEFRKMQEMEFSGKSIFDQLDVLNNTICANEASAKFSQ